MKKVTSFSTNLIGRRVMPPVNYMPIYDGGQNARDKHINCARADQRELDWGTRDPKEARGEIVGALMDEDGAPYCLVQSASGRITQMYMRQIRVCDNTIGVVELLKQAIDDAEHANATDGVPLGRWFELAKKAIANA